METKQKGIIAWFTRNPVAANLLMVMIILFGIVSAFTIRKQAVPDFELNFVNVRVPYLGAAPQEVEEGVVVRIEEAISDLPGIVELNSSAAEGIGTVTAEISLSTDIDQALNDIKTRVDAISTFPALAEKPVIYKIDAKVHVVFISIYGELDEYGLKTVAQDVRDDLLALPAVNQVEILSDRPYEISIEVSEHTLRQYSMTLSDVADAIRRSSVDLPGGTIRSDRGNILLRTEGQVYRGIEYATLVLRTNPDGSRVTLSDIATIKDGFVEDDGFSNFNGKPTAVMRVLATSQQSELLTAKLVNEYAAVKNEELPDGVSMQVWGNQANYLQARLDMMLKNMAQGALLVFIILTLFLRLKVAIWVIIGIPITFFGALWLMPLTPWPTTIRTVATRRATGSSRSVGR
ncbi:MAG: efflux RND transporter permease subunit [Pseudomonadota bacterium]